MVVGVSHHFSQPLINRELSQELNPVLEVSVAIHDRFIPALGQGLNSLSVAKPAYISKIGCDEIKLFLQFPRPRHQDQLMLSTGLRIGDACTISREKIVKYPKGWKVQVRTAKTGTHVYCPIKPEIAEAINGLPGKYPFWTGDSNAEDCAAMHRKSFSKLFKQAGVQGHIHQFRHTFAKRLFLSGPRWKTSVCCWDTSRSRLLRSITTSS